MPNGRHLYTHLLVHMGLQSGVWKDPRTFFPAIMAEQKLPGERVAYMGHLSHDCEQPLYLQAVVGVWRSDAMFLTSDKQVQVHLCIIGLTRAVW